MAIHDKFDLQSMTSTEHPVNDRRRISAAPGDDNAHDFKHLDNPGRNYPAQLSKA